MSKLENKKKLMFVKGEDFYFFTYNLLVLLDTLGCYDASKKFTDYRKLAFLIEFVANSSLGEVLQAYRGMETNKINLVDKESLAKAYSDGMIRVNQIMRLIFYLEKKGVLSLERVSRGNTINLWLNKSNIPNEYLNKNLFKVEYENANFLKRWLPSLKRLTLKYLLEKIFGNYGIKTWQV